MSATAAAAAAAAAGWCLLERNAMMTDLLQPRTAELQPSLGVVSPLATVLYIKMAVP